MTEILAPAGSAECAYAAMNNGADAIYLGLSAFSARHNAENFDGAEFCRILQSAHFCGVKVYVAMNTLVKDEELDEFLENLLFVWNEGADAIILQDVFLGKKIHELYPDVVLHLSTQAGICNVNGAKFAKACGFSRVILARETPLEEIEKIASFMETETFVQGALCTCFSGQCYFSSFAGGNSGNRGRCKQPCRKKYAYDRNGNTEKTYALSLSDLCVGESIEKYIQAGVCSFKIEGRMRRPEYVGAAVRYYRLLLDGGNGAQTALSDLKRTYNRGNYTKGLAFGQDKRFLSPLVQGHVGEKVGVIKVINGNYFVESRFQPRNGDAFKILREGKEVGGAFFAKTERKGFLLSSKAHLKNGDGVFITTDNEVNERVLSIEKRGGLTLDLYFKENEQPIARCKEITALGEKRLQTAQKQALTEQELRACFLKTDGLPIDVEFGTIQLQGNVFIPKSELNALRRDLYEKVKDSVQKGDRKPLQYTPLSPAKTKTDNGKIAVISNDFQDLHIDVAIYKPLDYTKALPQSFVFGKFEKYLYYPAFATEKDEKALEVLLEQAAFDGIYAENYAGITFAKERNLSVFAGTGLNIFNSIAVQALLGDKNVRYYALSKELREEEAENLTSEKAFSLSSGDLKIMELCYCPFGKTCAKCDKRAVYTLTDENGREFPVSRIQTADGSCRFEVYNCAALIGTGLKGFGNLLDLTLTKEKVSVLSAYNDTEKQKQIYKKYTFGHYKRGVL